jgi:RHS repeat-associated protein
MKVLIISSNTLPATPTDRKYTGQQDAEAGLYFYGARWFDPYLNRWIQPDAIIPDPNNSQSYDRYAYAFNNPVKYTDPTGHWPDWLDSALDYAQGAAYQFTNDMTFGLVGNIATAMNLCVDCNRSEAFYEGQQGGRVASTVVSSTEAVLGTAAASSLDITSSGIAAAGLSNPEIAQELYLSLNTIKTHTRGIYGKLGVSNRTQATIRASELGLI